MNLEFRNNFLINYNSIICNIKYFITPEDSLYYMLYHYFFHFHLFYLIKWGVVRLSFFFFILIGVTNGPWTNT